MTCHSERSAAKSKNPHSSQRAIQSEAGCPHLDFLRCGIIRRSANRRVAARTAVFRTRLQPRTIPEFHPSTGISRQTPSPLHRRVILSEARKAQSKDLRFSRHTAFSSRPRVGPRTIILSAAKSPPAHYSQRAIQSHAAHASQPASQIPGFFLFPEKVLPHHHQKRRGAKAPPESVTSSCAACL